MSQEMKIRDEEEEFNDEQAYVEEEDEDFNPENANDDGFSSENDDDDDGEEEEEEEKNGEQERSKKKQRKESDYDKNSTLKEVKNANYSKIESEEGGLIKTRTQRALEEQQEKKFKLVNDFSSTVDIDEAWKLLQTTAKERLKHGTSSAVLASSEESTSQQLNPHEKIKIKRRYEYAGEMVTEEKWVLRESAEAKTYLNSLDKNTIVESSNDKPEDDGSKLRQVVDEKGKKLRIIKKRPPLLEGIINGSIKPRFNTLEKSRLDFAEFADKEAINDELQQHNKDGYLGKQDFLSRVQFHRDTQIKSIRRKELQNKNK